MTWEWIEGERERGGARARKSEKEVAGEKFALTCKVHVKWINQNTHSVCTA